MPDRFGPERCHFYVLVGLGFLFFFNFLPMRDGAEGRGVGVSAQNVLWWGREVPALALWGSPPSLGAPCSLWELK